jgi:VWFA-related protein
MQSTRWVRWVIAVTSIAAAGAAPNPETSPAAPPVKAAAYEHVEVRLAQLDVVVRDKSGHVVSGLEPKDFSVQEDGVPLEVVAVDEWGRPEATPSKAAQAAAPAAPSAAEAGTAAPSETPAGRTPEKRSFVIVFDALGDSTALRMNQAKKAAQQFAQKHLGPDDLAAVYQLDLSLRPVSGITSNKDEIARSIGKISWMSTSSLEDQISESVLSDTSTGNNPLMKQRLTEQAPNAASELDWQREHIYESLDNLAQLFQALPGRRILIVVSPGFPMNTAGDLKAQTGGFTMKFQSLIRSLSKLGVTAYTLDIGNDLAAGDVSQPIDWRIAVGKLGMDENILSDLGLERSLGSGSASSRRQFLGVLAGETGGRMLTSTDMSRDFESIQEESSHFYRIACRVPVTPETGRYRKTVVKVNRPDLVVTTRRGRYSDVTPLDRPEKGAATAVESLDKYRPLAARGVAVPLPSADPKKIPVAVVLEAVGPIDLPPDAQGRGAMDVEFHLVARAAGEIVDRYDRAFSLKVKPDGIALMRRGFRVEGRLSLFPGLYDVQGTLRLATPAQLATWTSTVAVPPPPKGTVPAFSATIVTSEAEPASPTLSRPNIPVEADPLMLKPGLLIYPPTSLDFDAGRTLLVAFWIKGIPEVDGKPQATLGAKVLNSDGKPIDLPSSMLFFGVEPTGGYRGLVRVDARALPVGSYALRLEAGAPGSASPPARMTVAFALHAAEAALTSPSAP